jgi:hypothetical protein
MKKYLLVLVTVGIVSTYLSLNDNSQSLIEEIDSKLEISKQLSQEEFNDVKQLETDAKKLIEENNRTEAKVLLKRALEILDQ